VHFLMRAWTCARLQCALNILLIVRRPSIHACSSLRARRPTVTIPCEVYPARFLSLSLLRLPEFYAIGSSGSHRNIRIISCLRLHALTSRSNQNWLKLQQRIFDTTLTSFSIKLIFGSTDKVTTEKLIIFSHAYQSYQGTDNMMYDGC